MQSIYIEEPKFRRRYKARIDRYCDMLGGFLLFLRALAIIAAVSAAVTGIILVAIFVVSNLYNEVPIEFTKIWQFVAKYYETSLLIIAIILFSLAMWLMGGLSIGQQGLFLFGLWFYSLLAALLLSWIVYLVAKFVGDPAPEAIEDISRILRRVFDILFFKF